ncbi:MAG: hypothetical protein R3300_03455 [Candidatus Promineifilaceae bacterium]|nr:hypothetical protein [Candidatus Promineifilaceae bacterium]
MKHITISAGEADGFIFDLDGLVEKLNQLSDTCWARGKSYPLPFILALILLAKPSAMAEWIHSRQ